jgi:hypothetical protein
VVGFEVGLNMAVLLRAGGSISALGRSCFLFNASGMPNPKIFRPADPKVVTVNTF